MSMETRPSSGRPTAAEQVIRDAEKAAEVKARNLERRREQMAKTRASAGTAKHYNHKDTAGKVEMAMTQMLTQFVKELQGKPLLDVDFTNKESVARRKDQLIVIKETMATIRQLRELKEVLADDQAKGSTSNPISAENMIVFDTAKELLAKSKIKADL